MREKLRIRKRYLSLRKKRYFENKPTFFSPLLKLISKKFKKKRINVFGYYPASHEVNVLKIFERYFRDVLKMFQNYLHFLIFDPFLLYVCYVPIVFVTFV